MTSIFNGLLTYWNSSGRHEDLVEPLQKLIPWEGSVPEARFNPALERFRRASNVYYDVFNNGLGNRGREFFPVFRFRSGDYRLRNGDFQNHFYQRLEEVMDQIILDAAQEQGLTTSVVVA